MGLRFLLLNSLLLGALSLRAFGPVGFFFYVQDKERNNPHDHKGTHYQMPAPAPSTYYDSKDPRDDARAGATALPAAASGASINDGVHYVGFGSDSQDWYALSLNSGASYDLTVDRLTGLATLNLEFYDPAGSLIAVYTGGSYPLVASNVSVPSSGAYHARVVVSGASGVDQYVFTLSDTTVAAFTATSTPSTSATATATDTPAAPPTATSTPVDTDTFSATPSETPTFTDLPPGSSSTDTPEPSATFTPTPSSTSSRTSSPSPTPTATRTATPSLTATRTSTPFVPTSTWTQTPSASPSWTPSPAPTAGNGTTLLYDGDTAGASLADGLVTNDESVTAGTGTMTEATGGSPGDMMRLNYAGQAAYWQSHQWDKTVNVDFNGADYLVFNVRQEGGVAVTQFKIAINWPGTDVYVASYLVEGGAIDSTWKTARIPLSVLTGAGQTQFDFISFINNSQNSAYTVNVDNLRLETSATPTFTQTLNPAWSFTFTPTISPTSTPYTGMRHPGAWSTAAELDFVKAKIAANQQPWTQQLANLVGQTGAASSGVNFNGVIQNSCTQEGAMQTDAHLLYANALAWYLTGNTAYYTKAMNILSNYAGLLGFQSSGCFAGQRFLDASWFGVLFANACELLRTSPSWTAANTATYVNMFKTAFYPTINVMSGDNGNIDLTEIDAMFSMAVFCDDQAEWNLAVTRYQNRMAAYFYDSAWPAAPSANKPLALGNTNTNNCGGGGFPTDFWYCPTAWTPGLTQETCRDLGHHTQFALDAAIQCAEIDYHQGSPNALYATYQTSLVPALELLARQFVTVSTCGACSGTWPAGQQKLDTFEIGFNHYANRAGLAFGAAGNPLYYTNTWINSLRANTGTTWMQFNIAFETLTHAGVN